MANKIGAAGFPTVGQIEALKHGGGVFACCVHLVVKSHLFCSTGEPLKMLHPRAPPRHRQAPGLLKPPTAVPLHATHTNAAQARELRCLQIVAPLKLENSLASPSVPLVSMFNLSAPSAPLPTNVATTSTDARVRLMADSSLDVLSATVPSCEFSLLDGNSRTHAVRSVRVN